MRGGYGKTLEGIRETRTVDVGRLWNGGSAIKLVEEFLKEVLKYTRVMSVVVIGSRAKNRWKETSDIDLIVVSDKEVNELLPKIKGFGVVDPRPYTKRKLLEGIMEGDTDLIEAFEEGKIIKDDGTWREAAKIYEWVKKILKIERYEEGWRIKERVPKEELLKSLRHIPITLLREAVEA